MTKKLLVCLVVVGALFGCQSGASDVDAKSASDAYQKQDEKAKALEKQTGEVRRDRG